jgi:hypothetical protein
MAAPTHNPAGNPCRICGKAAVSHYVEHTFSPSDIGRCTYQTANGKCGLFEKQHREPRKRIREHKPRPGHGGRRSDKERGYTYIGIDGEGQGRKDHRYVLLAASTENGEQEWIAEVSNPRIDRLTTVECLNMILELPTRRSRIFSFSFNYDLTKMLMDLPNHLLYRLFRPELRKGEWGPSPIEWCPICNDECEDDNHPEPYKLNLQGTKFQVQLGKKRVVVWDLFKFFQGKFLTAIKDWKVGTPALWDRIEHMKDRRADFDKETALAVRNYCLEETRCIGELAHRLVQAHEDVDLNLKTYYGAGSSGAAMLEAMGIKEKLSPSIPEMRDAIAAAFFGGRFENSVIGAIRQPLVNWDISSAYVYQLAFLPCLEHGSWTHTKHRNDLEKAEAQSGALVRYSLGPNPRIGDWGPFPFRTKDGSISFPITSGGGWLWLDEYLAGERLFPHVRFHEAWVYSSNCGCKPFQKIPEYYLQRLKIGKEGPGIVIKLGMNSCYGKLAQSVGNAIFNSWIWAGMITSGTRAQLLELLGLHKDRSDVLMMATDGLLTRDHSILPPSPLPTGTGKTGKPLGGWERKDAAKGMFIARPGIYFPLEPTIDEIQSVRARGVGRSVVLNSWQIIQEAWERYGVEGVATVANVSRFCGAKTSISVSGLGTAKPKYKRANGTGNSPSYGQWISRKVELSFNPMPKRACVNADGLTLGLRSFPQSLTSIPYDRALMNSADAQEMQAAAQEAIEQPDADLTEYELDEDVAMQ